MLCIHRAIRSLACAGRIEYLNSEPNEALPGQLAWPCVPSSTLLVTGI